MRTMSTFHQSSLSDLQVYTSRPTFNRKRSLTFFNCSFPRLGYLRWYCSPTSTHGHTFVSTLLLPCLMVHGLSARMLRCTLSLPFLSTLVLCVCTTLTSTGAQKICIMVYGHGACCPEQGSEPFEPFFSVHSVQTEMIGCEKYVICMITCGRNANCTGNQGSRSALMNAWSDSRAARK